MAGPQEPAGCELRLVRTVPAPSPSPDRGQQGCVRAGVGPGPVLGAQLVFRLDQRLLRSQADGLGAGRRHQPRASGFSGVRQVVPAPTFSDVPSMEA